MMFVSCTYNMTGTISVTSTAYPAGAQEFPQYLARVAQSVIVCVVMFWLSLFVSMSSFC